MNYDELVTRTASRADLEYDEAQSALRATLATLSERISDGEADDLAAQLPAEAAEVLRPVPGQPRTGGAEPFDAREFITRVGQREGRPAQQAQDHARAVFETLREAVAPEEFDNAMAQLPENFTTITAAWRA